MSDSFLALFGSAERGQLDTAYYCTELEQLFDLFGEPPKDTKGLFFAIQVILIWTFTPATIKSSTIANSINDPKSFPRLSDNFVWNYSVTNEIRTVDISSDGKYIVAGSGYGDKQVYFFDRSSSTPLWNYTTEGLVRSVSISSDGTYMVAGTSNWDIHFFNTV